MSQDDCPRLSNMPTVKQFLITCIAASVAAIVVAFLFRFVGWHDQAFVAAAIAASAVSATIVSSFGDASVAG